MTGEDAKSPAEKARENRAMFDRLARRYDLVNHLMTLGMDGRWRRRLARMCDITEGTRCLDLCCGTGSVTVEMARLGGRVTGLDTSERMLAVARRRFPTLPFVQGDALMLPFADGSFDAVTIAFGNRNVANLEMLYAEMRRVCVPGGRIVSMEITRPDSLAWRALFMAYLASVPPLLAVISGGDAASYRFLLDSVRKYPTAGEVAEIMRGAGIREVAMEAFMGGGIVLHRGIR